MAGHIPVVVHTPEAARRRPGVVAHSSVVGRIPVVARRRPGAARRSRAVLGHTPPAVDRNPARAGPRVRTARRHPLSAGRLPSRRRSRGGLSPRGSLIGQLSSVPSSLTTSHRRCSQPLLGSDDTRLCASQLMPPAPQRFRWLAPLPQIPGQPLGERQPRVVPDTPGTGEGPLLDQWADQLPGEDSLRHHHGGLARTDGPGPGSA